MKKFRNRQKLLVILGVTMLCIVAALLAIPSLGASLLALAWVAPKGLACAMIPFGARILRDKDGADGNGLTEAQFQTKVLGGVADLQKKIADLEAGSLKDSTAVKEQINKLALDLQAVQRAQQSLKRSVRSARPGEVSTECARALGAIALVAGLRGGQIQEARQKDFAAGMIKDILNLEVRTALTSSDIPLPVEYQGDVAELVSIWGAARQFGTVIPLGNGVVKLPRLKTDTTFGLIAGSGTVTEKSPQTEWVTFTAEKFGGLVRLPSEMDEDSIVAIGQFVARYSARQLAYVEDYQFFRSTGAGSGINGTAEGLCKSVVTDSKTTVSGVLGSPSEFTLAHFRTLRTVCDAAALRQGAYYLHPSFEQLLSSFNTSGNKPYNPNAQLGNSGGQPFMNGPTLDGLPVRFVDAMPVYSTSDVLSTVHVLFGDVSFQYLGIRGGIRYDTSTEAGFTTDEILIRALERLTTGKMATGAVAGLITHSA
jgi:HK97 family phage major capsid protein